MPNWSALDATSWTKFLSGLPRLHDCIVDSNGPVRIDTIVRYDSLVYTDTVIIDSMEYFQVGPQLIRIQNNCYYQRINGVDVQYLVENPTVGMTWSTTAPTPLPNMPPLVHTDRVIAIRQALQTTIKLVRV